MTAQLKVFSVSGRARFLFLKLKPSSHILSTAAITFVIMQDLACIFTRHITDRDHYFIGCDHLDPRPGLCPCNQKICNPRPAAGLNKHLLFSPPFWVPVYHLPVWRVNNIKDDSVLFMCPCTIEEIEAANWNSATIHLVIYTHVFWAAVHWLRWFQHLGQIRST